MLALLATALAQSTTFHLILHRPSPDSAKSRSPCLHMHKASQFGPGKYVDPSVILSNSTVTSLFPVRRPALCQWLLMIRMQSRCKLRVK